MYFEHYGLSAPPFQLGPDPRFYFGSSGHRKALAYLTYGLQQGEGFVIVTGEVGAGKTTMIQYLMTLLDADRYVPAQIVTSQLGADDTLRMVAAAFAVDPGDGTKASLLTGLERQFQALHAAGRRPLLIIDEVQNMALPSLEELRMLSNLQAGRGSLLQTLLVGQPQFRAILGGADLEQLRQRVTASYHLGPLSREETEGYIRHRLKTVGWAGKPEITAAAFDAIQSYSGGVPRRINALCTRLLLMGMLDDLTVIDEAVARRVGEEWQAETAAAAGAAEPAAPPPDLVQELRTLSQEMRALSYRIEHLERQPRPVEGPRPSFLTTQLMRLRAGGRGVRP